MRRFVQSSDWSLDFGRDDLVLFDLLIERTSGYAEPLRGPLDPPALLVQHSLDMLFLELDEREASVEKRCSHLRMAVEVKVLESDVFLITQQHGSFDNVTELANVAGP